MEFIIRDIGFCLQRCVRLNIEEDTICGVQQEAGPAAEPWLCDLRELWKHCH